MTQQSRIRISSVVFGLLTVCSMLSAQDRYFPLNPSEMPSGRASQWRVLSSPQKYGYYQPVEVRLPSSGQVTLYQGSPQNAVAQKSPATAGMMVGHTYRVKVSGMPEFPGIELYPTIELLDRLHPPEGEAKNFPIPVEITAEEIEYVLQERMVTKVVYLEQPDFAVPFDQQDAIHVEELPTSNNLLQAADKRGRPMAILRIGGRIPDPNSSHDEFYSRSPLQLGNERSATTTMSSR